MPLPPPSIEDSIAAVERVLQSASFAKANRLYTFLEYVCHLTLKGREAEINEVNIGTNVFQRPQNYNTSDDTIVRTTARLLRQRLQAYYDTEGKSDSIRIEVPRGTYVPTFFRIGKEHPESSPVSPPISVLSAEPLAEPRRSTGLVLRGYSLLACVFVSVVFGALVAFAFLHPSRFSTSRGAPSDRLWASLFPPDRNTLLVPADTVLLMYEISTHRQVSLDDYIGGNFMVGSDESLPWMQDYRAKRYTAVTSVEMAAEFGRIPKAAPERLQVRFARDMQTADLRQANAILIGAAQNNPWVGLFRKELEFHLDWNPTEDRWHVLDDHPKAGQPAEWPMPKNDPTRTSYSQIALVHNLSGNGHVLILAGTSMFGSQAASDFLFNPIRMDPLLREAMRSNGSVSTFEILLQSNIVGNGSVNTRIAAVRMHAD